MTSEELKRTLREADRALEENRLHELRRLRAHKAKVDAATPTKPTGAGVLWWSSGPDPDALVDAADAMDGVADTADVLDVFGDIDL